MLAFALMALATALQAEDLGATPLVARPGVPEYAVLAAGPGRYFPVQGRDFWFSLGGAETEPAHAATLAARPIADAGPISCGVGEWEYSFHHLKNGEKDGAGNVHFGGYPTPPATRAEAMEVVKAYYQRIAEEARAKATPGQRLLFSSVNGHYCYQHYGCEWGCDIVGSETGENINSTQAHIAFTRGAARQYGKPWLIDFSSWYGPSMYDEDPVKHWGKYSGPDRGHSLSLHLRTYYAAYMAGADVVVAEGGWLNFFRSQQPAADGTLPLSTLGEQASEFYRFTQRHPNRGIPYAPIALMIDFHHGIFPGFGEKRAWNVFPYTEGDQSILDAWELFFPQSLDVMGKPNERGYLVASPHGDIVDVLLTNAPAEVMAGYPVLLLAGELAFDESLVSRLREYIQAGGTVLQSERDARNPTAAPLLEAPLGELPESGLERRAIGRGALVVFSGTGAGALSKLLTRIRQELIPMAVAGTLETLYNRTPHGWVITLINNEGITKAFEEPPRIDPTAAQTATITWTGLGSVARATLWTIDGETPLEPGAIVVEVPPGEVRVVEIVAGP